RRSLRGGSDSVRFSDRFAGKHIKNGENAHGVVTVPVNHFRGFPLASEGRGRGGVPIGSTPLLDECLHAVPRGDLMARQGPSALS
ncbi:MAG: hypothetical protein C7B43_14680, partial [Sulfobacillus benefaciens]